MPSMTPIQPVIIGDDKQALEIGAYNPRNSDWEYALYVSIVLIMIGLMGEFYTRRHASASWGARR